MKYCLVFTKRLLIHCRLDALNRFFDKGKQRCTRDLIAYWQTIAKLFLRNLKLEEQYGSKYRGLQRKLYSR